MNVKLPTRLAVAIGIFLICGVAPAPTANAAKVIKLTAVDGYPPKTLWVKDLESSVMNQLGIMLLRELLKNFPKNHISILTSWLLQNL